jgi:hypothetical protein
MKNLILSTIIVLTAFVVFLPETSLAHTGSSPEKFQPPKVFRPSKQKQAKIKGKTNRRKSEYPYIVLTNNSTKRKYRGKVDSSKVPPVIRIRMLIGFYLLLASFSIALPKNIPKTNPATAKIIRYSGLLPTAK